MADISRATLKVEESPKAKELRHAWFRKKEESCLDLDLDVVRGWEMPKNWKKFPIGVPKRSGYTDLVKITRDPITNSVIVTSLCRNFFEDMIRAMPYDVSYEFFPFEKPNGEQAGD